jgi:hypothetical protein
VENLVFGRNVCVCVCVSFICKIQYAVYPFTSLGRVTFKTRSFTTQVVNDVHSDKYFVDEWSLQ